MKSIDRNNFIFLSILLVLCAALTSCRHSDKTEIDQIALSPRQSKNYLFQTNEPMEIGILLNHDVSGGIVELQQADSIDTDGTGSYWVSRQWQPKNNKIELKLVNNSTDQVEVIVFNGEKPTDSLLNK